MTDHSIVIKNPEHEAVHHKHPNAIRVKSPWKANFSPCHRFVSNNDISALP